MQGGESRAAEPGRGFRRLRAWSTPAFLAVVWAGLLLVALVRVHRHGVDMPWMDDFDFVPVLSGEQPFSLTWLWSLHNEHRNVVPRCIVIGVAALFDNDFRAPLFVNVVVLALAAWVAMLAARRLRGRCEPVDVVFPLLLMHWDHAENILWAHQIQLTITTLTSLLVVYGMVAAARLTGLRALWVGACVLTLPASGANGLILAMPFVGWLLVAAWKQRRGPGPGQRVAAALALAWALATGALIAFYFVDYYGCAQHPSAPSLFAVVRTAFEFLSTGFGSSGALHWPVTPCVLAILLGGTLLQGCVVARRCPEQRLRWLALLAGLAGVGMLAVAVGFGRSGFGKGHGFAARYTAMAVPALVVCALFWASVPRAALARVVPFALCLVVAATFVENDRSGTRQATHRTQLLRTIAVAGLQGLSDDGLVEHFGADLFPDPATLRVHLRQLRAGKLGPWRVPEARRKDAVLDLVAAPGGALGVRPSRLVEGPLPVRQGLAQWEPALLAPPGTELRFAVKPGARRFVGKYGVLEECTVYGSQTDTRTSPDGVWFTITLEGENGSKRELLASLVDPFGEKGSDAVRAFDVALEPGDTGELVLRTAMGKPGRPANALRDDAFWQAVQWR